jgi:hypothetical protein
VSQPTNRGRTAAAVLLAVLFLAVIGASVGYVWGAHDARARAAGGSVTQGPTAARTTPATGGSTPAGDSTPTAPPTAVPCLAHTEELARRAGSPGGLIEAMYLKTTGSEVWVCKDSGGRLWYQGHVRSSDEKAGGTRGPLIEGDNALFLSTVEPEGDGYVATNRVGDAVTRYHVSVRELVIELSDGRQEHQAVLQARLGR